MMLRWPKEIILLMLEYLPKPIKYVPFFTSDIICDADNHMKIDCEIKSVLFASRTHYFGFVCNRMVYPTKWRIHIHEASGVCAFLLGMAKPRVEDRKNRNQAHMIDYMTDCSWHDITALFYQTFWSISSYQDPLIIGPMASMYKECLKCSGPVQNGSTFTCELLSNTKMSIVRDDCTTCLPVMLESTPDICPYVSFGLRHDSENRFRAAFSFETIIF
jgi:hypothetical protein